jgi:hypothetical protein
MELGLEPGIYRITMQQGDRFFKAEVQLVQDRHTPLAQNNFSPIGAVPSRARGDGYGFDEDMPSVHVPSAHAPFSIQFVPSLGFPFDESDNNVLIGIIGAQGRNLQGIGMGSVWVANTGTVEGIQMGGVFSTIDRDLKGIQMSGVFNKTGGDMQGIQMGGIFNEAGGDMQGIQMGGIFNKAGGNVRGTQAAGIFNTAGGDMDGVQMAGIFNIAGKNLRGVQAGLYNQTGAGTGPLLQVGLINVSGNEETVPVGLVNVIKNGIMRPALYYDDMGFFNLSIRSGSKHFYSLLSVGTQRISFGTLNGRKLGIGKDSEVLVYRFGLGGELSIGRRVFLDLDVSSGTIIDFTTLKSLKALDVFEDIESLNEGSFDEDAYEASTSLVVQARFTAGFNIFKHLSLFGGLSYDYLYRFNSDTSPDVNRSIGSFEYGWSDGRNVHKLGFFGGVQF